MLYKLLPTFLFLLLVCEWYLCVFQTERYVRFLSKFGHEQSARVNVAVRRWFQPVAIMFIFYVMLAAWGVALPWAVQLSF
jgi:hypothetical protein